MKWNPIIHFLEFFNFIFKKKDKENEEMEVMVDHMS